MNTTECDIFSAANPKIKQALSLRERKNREHTGTFLIEGYRELSRAATHGVQILELFYCPSFFLGNNEPSLLSTIQQNGGKCIKVAPHILEKLSYRDRPDGLIAVARKMDLSLSSILDALKNRPHPLVIIAEALEKPGNLGTIIRSADAAGADCVIVTNRTTDIYNPNVVRSSVGTLFTIPVVEATNEETLLFAKQLHLSLIAATPEGSSLYTDVPMQEATGIVVGTEQLGLSSFWKKECTYLAQIPMHGVADSLNVATATTLFLFEAVRQRQ